jgi:hypothetical protein
MIGADILEAARTLVQRHGYGEAALAALRVQWPQLRFVTCSDDDVPPRLKPAASGEGWALYYIAGGEHCISLTAEPDSAIGLVLAECQPDD